MKEQSFSAYLKKRLVSERQKHFKHSFVFFVSVTSYLLNVFSQRKHTNTLNEPCSGALDHTISWIKSVVDEMWSAAIPTQQTNSEAKGRVVPGPFQVLNAAFIRILMWDYEKSPLPEVSLC